MDEDAQGRRRRGLILAGIVLVIGVPMTMTIWLSERNVDRQASDMAEDLRRAGRQVDDVAALAREDMVDTWDATAHSSIVDTLGHADAFRGSTSIGDDISAAYEVQWGLATRCVHLLLREDAPVRTEITDSATCRPLPLERPPTDSPR